MNKAIQAKVNERLLTKASRLFTGTLAGRIVEILQNARRAGATQVHITNKNGRVTVRDNGCGVKDFATLLDLGGSNWTPPESPPPPESPTASDADLEASEDPAGVGLFCLAPREVVVRSQGHVATIPPEGWTGAVVEVHSDLRPRKLPTVKPGIQAGAGTELQFQDQPWTFEGVGPLAVFTGLNVTVEGKACPKEPFIHGESSHIPGLGCRMKVISDGQLTEWHRGAELGHSYSNNVLVNFHGQVVSFSYAPVTNHHLIFLVDLTGEPTGIRLMLPARTQVIENQAMAELKTALEREAFLYLQRQGLHKLPYNEWLRARELGIKLPEAEPTFEVGLLRSAMSPEPVEVIMPKGHQLAQCYRLNPNPDSGGETDEANAHLLGALGKFNEPFVPVEISPQYDGYSWASLPTIDKVEVKAGKTLLETFVWSGQLTAVETLSITAHTSDGKVYSSPVAMAIKPPEVDQGDTTCLRSDYLVYVTTEARRLGANEIWFHLGGWSDEGDTYDTQESDFCNELDRFWAQLVGPDEPLRVKLMDCVSGLKEDWRSITILSSGCVTIRFKDGSDKAILPASETLRENLEAKP